MCIEHKIYLLIRIYVKLCACLFGPGPSETLRRGRLSYLKKTKKTRKNSKAEENQENSRNSGKLKPTEAAAARSASPGRSQWLRALGISDIFEAARTGLPKKIEKTHEN